MRRILPSSFAVAGEGARLSAAEAWPFYGEDEIAAVVDVLRSGGVNQWTSPHVEAFSDAFARRMGGRRGVAVANGSLALELPLRIWGVGEGDEVIVTPRSFVASAACVRLLGATPIFADVDHNSGNVTVETITPLISERTRAIIVVHLAGWPADMPAIMALASRHRIKVIEDCAQAHGATIELRPVGSFGDAAAFSFCQDKIITTGGEGGFVIFDDEEDCERGWSFKDHGKSRAAMRAPSPPGFRYVHDRVGTNWRMTAMQAALGSVQLGKLDLWLAARRRNAAIWRDALSSLACLRAPGPDTRFEHAYYKFYVYLRPDRIKASSSRDAILAELVASGLKAFSGTCPEIYREKAFADLGIGPRPVAAELGRTSLMFEVHPTLDPVALQARARKAAALIAAHAA